MSSERLREIYRKAHVARWTHIRRLGFWRYVLLHGVLGWGIPTFVLMTFLVSPPARSATTGFVLVSAGIWLIAGAWFGWMTWRSSEKKYKKFVDEQGQDASTNIK
jgi:hypothetical protein